MKSLVHWMVGSRDGEAIEDALKLRLSLRPAGFFCWIVPCDEQPDEEPSRMAAGIHSRSADSEALDTR